MSIRIPIRIVFVLTITALAASAAESLPDPAKPGPFPVGVTTTQVVDPSRTDPATNAPRTLMTEIWYPATDDAQSLPKNRLMDFCLKGENPPIAIMMKLAFNSDLEAVDKTFRNTAVRDARVRDGKYPLLLFSHGNGGFRFQNAFWCEYLASHGYIVVAPDHTGNSLITGTLDKAVAFQDTDGAREQAAKDRPKDISFLIDTMDQMNKGADSRFIGKIDLDRIGVAGHSFGGYTSTATADQDPRVDAIAPMAAVARERVNYDCPVMLLIATEDDTIGLDGNARMRTYYDDSKGPKYLVEFLNAGHYSFTEMYQFNPEFGDGVGTGKRITNDEPITYITMDAAFGLTNAYTTAFFGVYLKGQTDYAAYMTANHNPDELIVKSAAPAAP
jgi:dienelactone hydrolase